MGTLLIALLSLLLMTNCLLARVGTSVLVLAALAVMVRLFVPFEFGFEKSIYVTEVLPQFHHFFVDPLFSIGKFEINLLYILSAVWAIGLIAYVVKEYFISRQFRRRLFQSEVACDPNAMQALFEIYSQDESRVRYRLLQTPYVDTPMLTGMIRPLIVLPRLLLSKEEWEHILRHEMAHNRNRDLWVKFVCELLCAVYWWNPIVFLFRTRLSRALEIHTDMAVMRHMNEASKLEYMQCLVKVSKMRSMGNQSRLHGLAFTSSSLEQRFQLMLNTDMTQDRKRTCGAILAFFILLAVIVLSFSFVLEPRYPSQDGSISLTPENAYFVEEKSGGFTIYVNDVFFCHTTDNAEIPPGIPLHNEFKEVNES